VYSASRRPPGFSKPWESELASCLAAEMTLSTPVLQAPQPVCKTAEEWKIPSAREYDDSYAHSIRSSMGRERDGREDSVQPFAFFLCKSLCIMRFSAESYSKYLLFLFLSVVLRKHIRGKMTSVHPCLNVSHPRDSLYNTSQSPLPPLRSFKRRTRDH